MASLPSTVESRSAIVFVRDYCLRALPWLGKGSLAVLDQGLISGSNFLIAVLLARWLGPEHYGAYALAYSIFLFLSGFYNALFLEPMSVIGPASYRNCLPLYLGKLLKLHFVLAIPLSALVVVSIFILRHFSTDRALPPALWGVCLAAPLILFFWLCRRGAYLELASGLAAKAAAAYFLAVSLMLLLVKELGWLGSFTAFLIQALAATAAAILLIAFLKPRLDSHTELSSSEVVRRHWRYGRWSVWTQFVYWLSGNAYYVIIATFLQMRDVATLRALQNFYLPFGQFMTAIGLLLLPWASERFTVEGRKGLRRRVRQITLLFTGMAFAYYALLWLFGGKIIQVLYAGRYAESLPLLMLVAAPVLVVAASEGSLIAVQAVQSPADVFIAYAVSAVATVAVGVPLTRCWGLPGAALGMLVSYLAFFAVITHRCRVILRETAAI